MSFFERRAFRRELLHLDVGSTNEELRFVLGLAKACKVKNKATLIQEIKNFTKISWRAKFGDLKSSHNPSFRAKVLVKLRKLNK